MTNDTRDARALARIRKACTDISQAVAQMPALTGHDQAAVQAGVADVQRRVEAAMAGNHTPSADHYRNRWTGTLADR